MVAPYTFRDNPNKLIIISVVSGSGRSGTTLLARLLGEIEGCVNVGEVNQLIAGKLRDSSSPCGCGSPPHDCPFWKGLEEAIPDDLQDYDRRWLRTRWFPFLLLSRSRGFRSRRFAEFLETLAASYAEIARRANCRVIVDSSKPPVYLYALTLLPDAEVHMIHLVRNPQEVAVSWSKQKGDLPRYSAWKTLLSWSIHSVWLGRLGRRAHSYWEIRFEDFAANPRETMQSVVNEIFGRPMVLPFKTPRAARIHEQHHVAGNPDKMTSGDITIRPAAVSHAPFQIRILARLLTFPLLRRYGYR